MNGEPSEFTTEIMGYRIGLLELDLQQASSTIPTTSNVAPDDLRSECPVSGSEEIAAYVRILGAKLPYRSARRWPAAVDRRRGQRADWAECIVDLWVREERRVSGAYQAWIELALAQG